MDTNSGMQNFKNFRDSHPGFTEIEIYERWFALIKDVNTLRLYWPPGELREPQPMQVTQVFMPSEAEFNDPDSDWQNMPVTPPNFGPLTPPYHVPPFHFHIGHIDDPVIFIADSPRTPARAADL